MVQFCYLKLHLGIRTVSCFATDGKHGHGLKIENVRPSWLCFNAMLAKITKICIVKGLNPGVISKG